MNQQKHIPYNTEGLDGNTASVESLNTQLLFPFDNNPVTQNELSV